MNFAFGQQQQSQQQQQPQQQQFQNLQQHQMSTLIYAEQLKKQNQALHLEQIKHVLTKIYEVQNQPQLQGIIQLLTSQLRIANEQLVKTIDQTDINKFNTAGFQRLYERGQNIRARNTIMTNKILLIKSKLQRMMYQHANPHSKYEYETAMAMDKIRKIKSEIIQKRDYLKQLQYSKGNDQLERRVQPKETTNMLNLGTALTELKNGTQILERQVLRQKIDMEILQKFIHEANQ